MGKLDLIGDKVDIRYMNEGIRKRLCLCKWFGIWGLPILLMIFGLLFNGIADVQFLLRNKLHCRQRIGI